jgi:hypothetical protein
LCRGDSKKKKGGCGVKKIRGKSVSAQKVHVPVFKPVLFLEDHQVPKELGDIKPGETVTLQLKGKVQSRREEEGNRKAVSIEVQALSLPKAKKKAVPGRKGGKKVG